MITGLIGQKIDQTQGFLEDGTRVPVTWVNVASNVVTQAKSHEKDGYFAIQIGFGIAKKPTKAISGHIKKAGITKTPRFFKEIRLKEAGDVAPGESLQAGIVFKAGDVIDVAGTSKGKGFAGVVKRHHFKGGPRTHGQSDRERAPGSIGQTTTPGRVYKGKRMAGRMGHEQVTLKNLLILDVMDNMLLIKGLVPGHLGSIVTVKKVGEHKKFVPLHKGATEEPQAAPGEEAQQVKTPAKEAKTETIKEPKTENKEKRASKDTTKEDR